MYFPVANEDMIHSQHYALNSYTDAHQEKKHLNLYFSQLGACRSPHTPTVPLTASMAALKAEHENLDHSY